MEEGRNIWERLHCHGAEREEVGLRITGYGFFVAPFSQIDTEERQKILEIRSPTWVFFSCCTICQNWEKETFIVGEVKGNVCSFSA